MKLTIALCALGALLVAQPKPAITPADYGKWETLGPAVLSPDGKWLSHQIRRTDGTYELRVSPATGGKPKVAPFGTDAAFSSDSRWVAYAIGVSDTEEERLKKASRPIPKKMGVMDLSSGTAVAVDGVQSFAFSEQDAYLAFRRSAPNQRTPAEPNGGGRGGQNAAAASAVDNPAADPIGTTLTVRNLATGVDTTFGNVTNFAWQDKGTHLAMTIGAEGRIGNSLQVFNPARGDLKVLDSGPAVFTALSWRKDSNDLAALRSKKDSDREGESSTALVWRNLTDQHAGEVAAPKRLVSSRPLQWSEDGRIVFIGLADWDRKLDNTKLDNTKLDNTRSDEDPSNVEVWHPRDFNVISEQKLRAVRDRDRNALAAWHVDEGRVVPLGANPKENVQLPRHGGRALAIDETPYETDVMFGRQFADVRKVDLSTGARGEVALRLIPPVWFSPAGHYALNFIDGDFFLYDLETGAKRNIGKDSRASFTDKDNDYPVRHKPSYGIAGWTKDDKSVIVYDDCDLWELPADGSANPKARRLTDGAPDQVRYRYANPEVQGRGGRGGGRIDREETIDLSKPVYLSMYGIWNKRTGYATLTAGKVERAVWLDKGVNRLIKAKNADVFAYVVEAFDDSPDYFVAGADLKNGVQVTETNPFASQYAWGHGELIEYKSPKGERLQGALFYPANYQPGKQYPMLVHIYERESNFLHRYFPVSERSPYTEATWSAHGYFVLMPDIVFRARDPGLSVVECVTAATRKALESGMIDPKRVGIIGHSWGGFGSTFTMTQTDMFAAAVAGGPLTNLVSSYGEIYWNSGVPETSHAEVGQERLEVPLWEDPQAYMRNSAVFHVNKLKGALMLCVGDKDGASDWHQDIEMYNLARRAGKNVVMLVYPGENHGLAVKANQIDYHRRILAWFDHYLKGDEAQPWITNGVSVLDREKELKRIKKDQPQTGPTGGEPEPR